MIEIGGQGVQTAIVHRLQPAHNVVQQLEIALRLIGAGEQQEARMIAVALGDGLRLQGVVRPVNGIVAHLGHVDVPVQPKRHLHLHIDTCLVRRLKGRFRRTP